MAPGDQTSAPFAVFEDHIRDDLTSGKERPIWPLSAYGPGVKAPRQLLEGAVEVSPEEMRAQFYLAQAAGKPQEYAQQEESMLQQVNQQIQAILNDLPGAKRYVIDGQDIHPNRNDMVLNPTKDFPKQSSFAQPTPSFSTTGSGFGAPSTLGGNKSAFGAPSAMGQGSAFGAPSSLGQSAGFGKPSPLGGGSGTAFGKSSPFGQPSSLGQKPSPFGSVQQQPQQQQQPSAFGRATQPSPFGQPSALGQVPGFGSQPQQPQQGNAFGQVSGFGAPANKASPFSQAALSSSPFAQASSNQTTNSSPFGQTASNQTTTSNPFAQAPQPASQNFTGFGQASQAQPSSNPFSSATSTQQNTGFGAPSATSNPFTLSNAAKSSFGATASPFGQAGSTRSAGFSSARSWHNQPVVTDEKGVSYYEVHAPTKDNSNNRRRERIWHPDGAPQAANLEIEGPAEAYTGDLGKLLEGIYATVRDTGAFGTDSGGIMPEIPPKREWISWEI